MKRIISLALALCLMLAVAVPAFAANDVILIASKPDDAKIAAAKLADEYDWKQLEGWVRTAQCMLTKNLKP